MSTICAVIIGRNEGERLRRCLVSVVGYVPLVVYVDSGSTDDSVRLARELGVDVVVLDTTAPFTAARARNAGMACLLTLDPAIEFIQFIDGDCELVSGWIERALAEFTTAPRVAVVCGRRRERSPGASIYNTLCDIEWDSPIGDTKACGGDALMRSAAFREVGGYTAELIAGEEPELCVRLRARGWMIRRIDCEMSVHDAAMIRFAQWWRRTQRTGYAFAQGAAMHGRTPERHWVHESRSIWFWGVALPVLTLATVMPTHGASLLLLAAYPAIAVRIYRRMRRRGLLPSTAGPYALFCVAGKFPEAIGQMRFVSEQLRRTPRLTVVPRG
jgi:glycosyltransferase involved in cell wall biosynthesis